MGVIAAAAIAVVVSCIMILLRSYLLNTNKLSKKTASISTISVAALSWVFFLAYSITWVSSPKNLILCFTFFALFIVAYVILCTKPDILQKLPFPTPRASFWIGLLAVLVPTIAFATLLSTRTFPIAEGWYSVYAKLVHNGEMPYTDFELLFMPLYTYIISFITWIFGYKLIVLRIFGVLLFAGITALTYCVLTKLFKPWTACIATITAALYLQSEVVQVFYDYIRVFDLFTYVATLLLMLHIAKTSDDTVEHHPISWRLILSGIFASLAFLVRQNSGAFVIAYTFLVVLLLIVYTKQKRLHAIYLGEYVGAVLVPLTTMIAYMYFSGALSAFLGATVGDALDSKGGIFTVLFAWIPRSFSTLITERFIFVALLAILGLNFYLYKKKSKPEDASKTNAVVCILFFAMLVAGGVIAFFSKDFSAAMSDMRSANLPYVVFYIAIVLFVIQLVWLFKNKTHEQRPFVLKLMTLTGMVIAIGYGSGTSAGLSEGQTALGIALIIALILHYSSHSFMHATRFIALMMSAVLCLSIVSFKYDIPYSWWGLTEPSIREANYEIEGCELLEGIKVSESTAKGYELILENIDKYTEEGDSIFVFPHAPIFYLLSDRYPDTYTYVQWFDVSSDRSVVKDIDVLKESNPKVIVYVKIDKYISSSHENLFRGEGKSGLSQMAEAIEALVDEKYYCDATFVLQNYHVEIYHLED